MNNFYAGAALLTLLALALIAFPWLRSRGKQPLVDNTSLIKQRLGELSREVEQGLLDPGQQQQAEQELKLALLQEQQVNTQVPGHPVGSQFWLIGAGLGALLGAVAIYWHSNQLEPLQQAQQAMARLPELGRRVVLEQDPSLTSQDLQDFALGIRHQLKTKPKDVTGWMLLGRLYTSLNRPDAALEAYERGLALEPQHSGILRSFSQLLLMSNAEEHLRKAQQLATQLLRHKPDDTQAMGIVAVASEQLGDTGLALRQWQQLLAQSEQGSEEYKAIANKISQLSAGLPGQTRVSVTVKLVPQLAERLPEQGVLFVFAKAIAGAPMPAAVVKLPVSAFPLQVQLTQANAMLADYSLANLSEALIVARVSLDGNVATAAGELQGEQQITLRQGQDQQVTIEINKVIE